MDFNINNWNNLNIKQLTDYLYSNQDLNYKNFNDRIVNTKTETIGVRTPVMRDVAKQICKGNYTSFLKQPMPKLFEFSMIYGLVLSKVKDNNVAYPIFSKFIKTIDNWAVCDIFCSEYKIVNKYKEFYLNKIKEYATTNSEFIVRVALILLMKFYITTNINDVFNIISSVTLNKYYVNMGIAWLLSMCYIKYKTETIDYILNNNLSTTIIRMTYQKIIDSKQVSTEDKLYIKSLRSKLKTNR